MNESPFNAGDLVILKGFATIPIKKTSNCRVIPRGTIGRVLKAESIQNPLRFSRGQSSVLWSFLVAFEGIGQPAVVNGSDLSPVSLMDQMLRDF